MSNFLKRFQRQQQPTVSPMHEYQYKSRFSMIGTVGSGKSTVAALTVVASQSLAADMPGFKCKVIESTSQIIGDASRLRRGQFPAKTMPYLTYAMESGLLMRWEASFNKHKNLQLPIADISGEDLQLLIDRQKRGSDKITNIAYTAAMSLLNYIKESDGYLIVIPASKAVLGRDQQFESESEGIDFDPDVNLHRILDRLFTHREKNYRKPLVGLAVCVTKWDMVQDHMENTYGIDGYNPQGLREFMNTFFPATSQLLGFYGYDKTAYFFPSYVQLERNEDGTPKLSNLDDPQSKIIKVKTTNTDGSPCKKPSFNEQRYIDLLKWLHQFAS